MPTPTKKDLTMMIVDLLRNGTENEALNRGGPVAGAAPPTPQMAGMVAPPGGTVPPKPGLPIKDDPEALLNGRRAQIEAALAQAGG